MKIAFLLGAFPLLSEVFILHQITGLLDAGHQVELFASKPSTVSKIHPAVESYDLLERTHYVDMPANKASRAIQAARLLPQHIFKHPLPLLKTVDILRFGKRAASLEFFYYWRQFLGHRFDIIHCHFGLRGVIGANLQYTGLEGKSLTTFYGHDLSSYLREHGNNVYQELFKRGDCLLPICHYFEQKLLKLGCPADKIRVLPLGVELPKFQFTPRIRQPHKPVNILTVARLIPKKGHEYALKSLAPLIKHYPDIHYTIAGDGPLRNALMSLVAELNLHNHVTFTGAVDQSEVIALCKKAHLFLLPSGTDEHGEEEGTPTVLLEAQAMGLPVISTRHSGIPEIVRDHQSGLLVPEKNIEALTAAIKTLLETPQSWGRMGEAGRRFVEQHHDIRQLNQQLLTIYEDVLIGAGRVSL
jgi:colanic acid/amylovoran biosynthesis glycosyltransferase